MPSFRSIDAVQHREKIFPMNDVLSRPPTDRRLSTLPSLHVLQPQQHSFSFDRLYLPVCVCDEDDNEETAAPLLFTSLISPDHHHHHHQLVFQSRGRFSSLHRVKLQNEKSDCSVIFLSLCLSLLLLFSLSSLSIILFLSFSFSFALCLLLVKP